MEDEYQNGHQQHDQHEQEIEIPTHFDSIEQEAAFWKEHAESLQEQINEVRLEIELFQLSASEIELDLEQSADRLANENVGLRERLERAEGEVGEVKARALKAEKNHNDNATSLQRHIDRLTQENDSARKAVVQLEMGHTELEEKERHIETRYLDKEIAYNKLMEEKILLEEDLAEKERLQEEVQRLKDEVRDQASDITYLKRQIEVLSARPPPSPASLDTTPQKAPSIAGSSLADIGHIASRQSSSFMSPVVEGNSFDISPVSPTFPLGVSSTGTPNSKRHSGIPLRALSSHMYADSPSPPAKPTWGLQRTNTLDTPSRQQQFGAGQRSPLGMAPGRSANLTSSTSSMTRSGTLTNIAGVAQGGYASPAHQQQERPRRLDSISSSRTITNMTPYTTGGPRPRVFSSAARPRGRIANQAEALAHRAGSTAPGTSKAGQAMQALRKQASQVQLRVSSAVHKPRPAAVRHSSPGLDGGDLTTISSGSPGGWTHVARSNSPDKVGQSSGGRQGSRLKFGGGGSVDGDSTLMPDDNSRSSQKTLPSRPGIPSPYRTRSYVASSTSGSSISQRRSPPEPQYAYPTQTASSSGSSISAENRPMTPSSESRLPILVSRPSSRASNYDELPPRSSSRLAQSTSTRTPANAIRVAFPSSSSANVIPSRPSSRTEGRLARPNGNGLPESSSQRTPQDLGASQSGLPRSTRRISTGPGLNKSQSGAIGNGGSAIPVSRRSVSGRPASMGHFATTPPPPVPQVAAQYRNRGEASRGDLSRDEMIGLGMPVPPKKR